VAGSTLLSAGSLGKGIDSDVFPALAVLVTYQNTVLGGPCGVGVEMKPAPAPDCPLAFVYTAWAKSGQISNTCRSSSLTLRVMWDLWWAKWYGGRFSPSTLVYLLTYSWS
jgi:hypothetical protein